MTYHEAIRFCADRYETMLMDDDLYWGFSPNFPSESHRALLKFIREIIEKSCDPEFPITKLNRWLGYVQGVLIEHGLTSVEVERDWTRPLFKPLDFPNE